MSDPLGLISNAQNAAGPLKPPAGVNAQGPNDGPTFKELLMKNIEQVNSLQQDAEKAIEDLAAGRRDDIANVMIAKNKADLAFQMMQQVKNKMVDAYEEIKQMRV